jgi:hypothetical protein
VQSGNMQTMATIAPLPRGTHRAERLAQRSPRRRRARASRGRAWINGREVGGADPRFAHLARSYD